MHTQLTEASVHEKIKEFYKFFPESLEDGVRRTTEELLEETLKQEMDILVGVEPYEHNMRRKAYRNGHYVRNLMSHHGLLRIRVPRIREGRVTFETLARYRRTSGAPQVLEKLYS